MHQIQRQIIEVRVQGNGDGFRWQQEVERLATGPLASRLEAVLDQYNSAETLVIDWLELDAGTLHEGSFEEEFLKAVEKKLNERLGQLRYLPTQLRPFMAYDTFLYFLKNGTLPWWADVEAYRGFLQEAESPESWNQYQPEHFAQLTETLRRNPPAFRRLQEQFSELFLVQLSIRLFQKRDPGIFSKWFLLQRILQDHRLFPTLASARYFYSKLIENLVFFPDISADFFVKILHKTLSESHLKAQVLTALPLESWESFLNELEQKFGEPFFQPISTPASAQVALEDAATDRAEKEKPTPEAGEYYYIANGGLVLLTPFLTAYLKNCEVANDHRLLDPEAAVHLIQYLVTGQAATPEYELVLNKVLCGLPIHAPVTEGIQLTGTQQQEAEDVLDSVLRYWPVMKNTSREGLQASFLQRPAKLSRRSNVDGGWLLQVEQASYDMLLSDLPWAYSPVALPWMPEPVWVEWS